MSRIGKNPIALPDGIRASLSGRRIEVVGPKGTLHFVAADDIEVKIDDGFGQGISEEQVETRSAAMGHGPDHDCKLRQRRWRRFQERTGDQRRWLQGSNAGQSPDAVSGSQS